jgi:hypothetical protein
MLRLPDPWIAHLEEGVSCRVATCGLDGAPQMRRALGVRQLLDGRLEVLLPRQLAGPLLEAIKLRRQVALAVSHPQTNRTLQVKGRDAEVAPAQARHQALFQARRDAFTDVTARFGFPKERMLRVWFDHNWPDLDCVRFAPFGAWDQTPGIGAGGVVELVEAAIVPSALDLTLDDPAQARWAAGMAAGPSSTVGLGARQLTLRQVRQVLDGIIPPSVATVSADGVPHASFLSHVEYVDEGHVALSYQFFNRTRANIQATGRAALMVECPYSGARLVMQLRYVRTEDSGLIFERMRAKLAGIAAHTGMEKVFRLLGADVFEVHAIERNDTVDAAPGIPPVCDVAEGARAVAAQLAEISDMSRLVPTFMDGLQQQLRVDHAILWLLDEQRENLTTLASLGYAHSGVGSELPLADAGLAGVALRVASPVRIGHMTSAYRYGMAWRERALDVGLEAVIAHAIPLPGLDRPGGQLAVPLRARGRSIGVLLVESGVAQRVFSYDDEDALMLLGAQLAQAMAALHADELLADVSAPTVPATAEGKPLRVRHYARDHSLFVDDEYLIKGVAGAILAKLVRDQIASGRESFSTRELRLSGGDLRLPEVQDNLGVRLLLLERRLAERDIGLRIERCGRGLYRLVASGPLELYST